MFATVVAHTRTSTTQQPITQLRPLFDKMSHARVHTQASNRAQKKKKRERPSEGDESRKVVFKSTLDNPLAVKWQVIRRLYLR